jgi:hypothetical protein
LNAVRSIQKKVEALVNASAPSAPPDKRRRVAIGQIFLAGRLDPWPKNLEN